jgi:predicted peroxiredoxin
MTRVLVQVTHGPEDPTKATLAFLVARTAREAGHDVMIFLVGDAVYLIKDQVLGSVAGVGIGTLKEHYDAVQQAKIPIYLSGLSSKGRGVSESDLQGKNAQFAPPGKLVELATQSNTVFTY